MLDVSLLLCKHFIKSRFNVGYCNTHLAFNINLVVIGTTLYSLCNGPLLHNIPHRGKLHVVTELYRPFTSKSSKHCFSITKFRDTEQTRHQTPSAQRPSTDATTFAAHQGAKAPCLGTAAILFTDEYGVINCRPRQAILKFANRYTNTNQTAFYSALYN